MSTTKTVSGYLVDKVSGAMVLQKGLEVGQAGITFSDGSIQTTAATIGAKESFSFAPTPPATAFTVQGGTLTTMASTETTVKGGEAIVSFNITTLAVTALVASATAVLQLTLVPTGASDIIFERQLTFVSTTQGGSSYNGAAIVNVPAGTTGLTVAAELYDTAGTVGAALQVELVPSIRVDYVPF